MAQGYEELDQDESLSLSISQIDTNLQALRSGESGDSAPSPRVLGQRFIFTKNILHSDLSEASNGTAEAIKLLDAPGGYIVTGAFVKTLTAFSGGGATTCTASIGISGNATFFTSTYDVLAAVSATNIQLTDLFKANSFSGEAINVVFTPDGAHNLADLTAGELQVVLCFLFVSA